MHGWALQTHPRFGSVLVALKVFLICHADRRLPKPNHVYYECMHGSVLQTHPRFGVEENPSLFSHCFMGNFYGRYT